jgi:hypothetical protein
VTALEKHGRKKDTHKNTNLLAARRYYVSLSTAGKPAEKEALLIDLCHFKIILC